MNAGLANLLTLKRHLLPDSWQTETQLDDILLDLGRGVAAQFEGACGRKWLRTVGDTQDAPGNVALIQLERYPVEGSPTITIRYMNDAAFTDSATDWIDQTMNENGIVQLMGAPATYRDRLRVTFTGGYWWDQSEDQTDVQPVGSTAVPADLLLAWLQQCKHVFAESEMISRRALASSQEQADANKAGGALALLPAVKAMLKPFCRLAA